MHEVSRVEPVLVSIQMRLVYYKSIKSKWQGSQFENMIQSNNVYPFKGMNGVVAVANSVQEAAEILRIGRSVMYSRNKKMQKMGLNDMADYKPTDWTGKVWITGREFDKDEKIKVRVAGEEKEMTALEIYEYLYS